MSREKGGGVRADVERLNSLVIELQMCQAWANIGLRDLEAGKSEIPAAILAGLQITQAVKACKEFSEYFEKKVGVSLSEEKEDGL